MAEKFKVGDKVRLKIGYLRAVNAETKKNFSGPLVVVGISDGLVRLSNGKNTGLCRITCGQEYVQK